MAGRIWPGVSTAAICSIVSLSCSDWPTERFSHFAIGIDLQPYMQLSDCEPPGALRLFACCAALPYSWRDGSEFEAKRS